MSRFQRYALYLAPPADSPLARFGAAWLGWDADRAAPVAHPALSGLPVPVADLTAAPRRYGFHGTLKPPFRLATGADEAELVNAVAWYARHTAGFDIRGLRLARIGRFLALVPAEPSAALDELACDAVRALDAFRAPMNSGEVERRRSAGLTPQQEALLAQWGYPYVMEEFRFHLTLTGPLEDALLEQVRPMLSRALSPLLEAPFEVREVCLFAEREDGFFAVLRRVPLARAAGAAAF